MRKTILIWFLFLPLSLFADINFLDLRFEYISKKDGLSSPNITCLFQDQYGFIWIGTDGGGINRYDGHTFVHFRHDRENPDSLASDRIIHIYEDSHGILWVATKNAGLNRMNRDTDTFTLYLHYPDDPSSLPHNRVRDIYEDSRDNLWIATDGGLALYKRKTDRFEVYTSDAEDSESLGSDIVTAIFEDDLGNLWIGTDSGICGLNRYNYDTDDFDRFLHDLSDMNTISDSSVIAIVEDLSGALWIITRSGIDRYDPESDSFFRYRYPGSFIGGLSALVDSRGKLWIGGDEGVGLLIYDREKDKFVRHVYSASQPAGMQDQQNTITSLLEDKSGTVWISTSNGLHFIPAWKRKYTSFLQGEWVRGFTEDQFGKIWISSTGNGYIHDPYSNSFNKYFIDSENRENQMQSRDSTLWTTSNGTEYALGFRGLFIYDRKESIFNLFIPHGYDEPGALNFGPHMDFIEDDEGKFWISAAKGVDRVDPISRTVEHYKLNGEWPVLHLDSSGRLWAGTRGAGLFILNDKKDGFLPFEGNISDDRVWSITADKKGGIWIGSDGGIDYLSEGAGDFFHYGEDESFPFRAVMGLEFDKSGNLWFSTANEIYRYNQNSEELRYIFSAEDSGIDGFLGNSSFCSTGGELYFGGTSGFVRIDPSGYESSVFHPNVVFTSFRLFEEEQKLEESILSTREIYLSWQDSFFAFEYASFDFSAPEYIQYAYRLDGWDENWISAGDRRYAAYTNIPGGSYEFSVKATNADGIWTTEENWATVKVTISTHPLKTWWAICIYVTSGLGLVFGILLLSRASQHKKLARQMIITEELKKVNHLKDEFLANTTHELRTPLHGIIGLAEGLLNEPEETVSEGTKKELSLIASSGRRLSFLINDILDLSRLKEGDISLITAPINLSMLTNTVLVLSKPLLAGKSIELVNDIPFDMPQIDGDINRVQQILHNLIGNAIKFTKKGAITVRARIIYHEIEVSVIDTGIGIPADKFDTIWQSFRQVDASMSRDFGGTGLGLSITKRLVELHGGRIWLESEMDRGSTFIFTLPISSGLSENTVPDSEVATIQFHGNNLPSVEKAEFKLSKTHGTRILMVDDEALNCHVVERQLENSPYVLSVTSNGEEALKLIMNDQHPDLVLLDLMMPGMDGYEVCRKIRQRYSPNELPVIIITAKNQVTDLVKGLSIGANDFISKPYSQKELLARIETQLKIVHSSYGRFVAKDLLDLLGKGSAAELESGDFIEKEMTLLLTDFSIETGINTNESFAFLSSFLPHILPLIRTNQGIVHRYEGEAVISFFPDSISKALNSAIEIQNYIKQYKKEHRLKENKALQVETVLHCGKIFIGAMGDDTYTGETVLSDVVKLTYKLRDLAQRFECSILVSEFVIQSCDKGMDKRLSGYFRDAGLNKRAFYEIILDSSDNSFLKKESIEEFETGIDYFYNFKFDVACVCFNKVLKHNPKDRAAQWYRDESIKYQKIPPAGEELI
jgi:signal transduction histidine kinase/ligand-binding sensor domain-containing protein/DNA-binding response OmpR family regulator